MMRPVKFMVRKQAIRGTLVSPHRLRRKNPGVLFIHGWASNQAGYIPRAEAVSKHDAICLTFDMRGHGESDGKLEKLSKHDHLNDVLAAYDFLVSQKKVDKDKIGVVGASYGGYLASLLTSKRPVKWLALRVPALYADESFDAPSGKMTEKSKLAYLKKKHSPSENMALETLRAFHGSVLFVESENDEEIPGQVISNYLGAINSRERLARRIIRGADHALSKPEWKQQFIDILSEWFKEQLGN